LLNTIEFRAATPDPSPARAKRQKVEVEIGDDMTCASSLSSFQLDRTGIDLDVSLVVGLRIPASRRI
jgi:hypothetical protein